MIENEAEFMTLVRDNEDIMEIVEKNRDLFSQYTNLRNDERTYYFLRVSIILIFITCIFIVFTLQIRIYILTVLAFGFVALLCFLNYVLIEVKNEYRNSWLDFLSDEEINVINSALLKDNFFLTTESRQDEGKMIKQVVIKEFPFDAHNIYQTYHTLKENEKNNKGEEKNDEM